MAHGSPDYWVRSHSDIVHQTAKELVQRPKYGEAQAIDIDVYVSANSQKTLMSILGIGKIYHGHLYIPGDIDRQGDNPILEIDNNLITSQSIGTLFHRYLIVPESSSLYVLLFDQTYFDYSIGLRSDMTFEESLTLKYRNDQGSDVRILGGIIYALI